VFEPVFSKDATRMRSLFAALATVILLVSPASAQSSLFSPVPASENFFGFGGLVLDALDPPTGFEPDHTIVGAGYQRFWGDVGGFLYGLEAGLAGRFGEKNSLEAWGGAVSRYNFHFEKVTVATSFTFGLSAVTDTMAGGEERREHYYDGGDATLLFYLGPEISVGYDDSPVEGFVRLHHRSGAWGTLGNVHGAADVLALGLRYNF